MRSFLIGDVQLGGLEPEVTVARTLGLLGNVPKTWKLRHYCHCTPIRTPHVCATLLLRRRSSFYLPCCTSSLSNSLFQLNYHSMSAAC